MTKSKRNASFLVINCGSSSLKFRLICMPEEKEIAGGEATRVGTLGSQQSSIQYTSNGSTRTVTVAMKDHSAAFRAVISLLAQESKRDNRIFYDCFAHRFVHPGPVFSHTTLIDSGVIAKLKKTINLAPIHNEISLKLIETCAQEFSGTPQFAVFDTAFHRTIPKEFATYALPEELTQKYHLRRIGFHGISHKYVMEESCRMLGKDPSTQKIISCHLGSGGSSVCAIKDGKSLNNSMGFTPLEGLMMNTRCGDLDIGVLFHIMAKNGLTADDAEKLLNFNSGILGVFNASSDMRDVAKEADSSKKAVLTMDMYIRRIRKYVGYYSLLLKKADIMVFTDTLGIEMPLLRERICEGMECFGLVLDKKTNRVSEYKNTDLTGAGSETRILAIPTNEEIMIARESYKELCDDRDPGARNR